MCKSRRDPPVASSGHASAAGNLNGRAGRRPRAGGRCFLAPSMPERTQPASPRGAVYAPLHEASRAGNLKLPVFGQLRASYHERQFGNFRGERAHGKPARPSKACSAQTRSKVTGPAVHNTTP